MEDITMGRFFGERFLTTTTTDKIIEMAENQVSRAGRSTENIANWLSQVGQISELVKELRNRRLDQRYISRVERLEFKLKRLELSKCSR